MKTLDELHIPPIDIHAAIARAHADRAEYIGLAATKVSALIKRVAAKVRPNRQRLPQTGVWA
jgi:hypothetical protein